ncbi:MAG: RNA methyltransferase [Oscillatoria sp. PMC 1068.18]|nr:RNA methyltransferase [Oscillatoria sp. PMC 1076.18]MEC4991579.1 RNA methyltransferase [Oscillatoria sp. PMC 1068.18]
MSELTKVRIILVEPAGALNVGSVARIMKNMGLQQLVLVKPHCDVLGQEATQMAVHAADVLEQALVVESLPEALKGCQSAIATTARSRTLPLTLEPPRNALPSLLTNQGQSALIFGPEDRGLSNAELGLAQRFISIPANPEYPSLNLAQAVAVCVYELYQTSQIDSPPPDEVNSDAATLDALENYYQHLEAILLKIGYLYPHTATARMEKFRQLYNRSALSQQELAMLRGILRQIEWALPAKNE